MFEQRSAFFRRRELHPSSALDHAHDDARSNTMAGDIGNISDPAPIVLKHIDQVATYLATRQRASVKLEPIALHVDGGDEHAVDLGGQRHLRVDTEIASALGN